MDWTRIASFNLFIAKQNVFAFTVIFIELNFEHFIISGKSVIKSVNVSFFIYSYKWLSATQ